MALGDGAVWWTETCGPRLSAVDPHSLLELGTLFFPDRSYGEFDFAAGFGALWLAEGGSKPAIHRIALPGGAASKAILASYSASRGKTACLALGEGSVWATVNVLDTLFRIDPGTGALVARTPLGRNAGHLAAGDGAVWVVQDGQVSWFDPRSNQLGGSISVPGLRVDTGRIALGGGSVWVVSSGYITRIDPELRRITATFPVLLDPTAPPVGQLLGHAVVTRDTLWVMAFRKAGTFGDPGYGQFGLIEIDTQTNSIRSVRRLGTGAAAYGGLEGPTFTVTDDAVWACQPSGLYVLPLVTQR